MDKFDWMRKAIGLAQQGDAPFGAVLVQNGRLLGEAANTSRADSTAHAEMELIRKVEQNWGKGALEGGTVYTTGEPCAMCAGALIWAGVDRIVFGASVDDLSQMGLRQIQIGAAELVERGFRKIEVEGGVLREEVLALFASKK